MHKIEGTQSNNVNFVVEKNEVVYVENLNNEKKSFKSFGEWANEYIAPDDSKNLNVAFLEKVPFILCIFLATLVTTFTFIWGVI